MFKVTIKNIKVETKIGVSDKERKKNQMLHVSLSFKYNLLNKKKIDNIKFLKDYSKIIKYLRYFIQKSHYKTLEKLIMECSKNLKQMFKIKNISLKVEKIETAKKYGCQSVSVTK